MQNELPKRALESKVVSKGFRTLYFPEVEGLGTTYEAYVTSRIMSRFVTENGINSVCEYPICTFRVPGAVAVPLALQGCNVTLATTSDVILQKADLVCKEQGVEERVRLVKIGVDKLESESFDLVFHVSLLPTMEKELGISPFFCLGEMIRLSRRYVIVTNHNLHYSVPLDRVVSAATQTTPQFGEVHLVGGNAVKSMFRVLGLPVVDEFFFDIPPWMAIDLKKLFSNIRSYSTKSLTRIDAMTIDNMMRRYSIIERSSVPRLLKRCIAHHVAIVAEKNKKENRASL